MLETPNTAGNLVPFFDPTCFDQRWMFGAQIGKDTTNNFAFSMSGLAIRTADNRFVAPQMVGKNAKMTDVTCLTIGMDPMVYRLPVRLNDIDAGDLLIRSDSPFQLVFVTSTDVPGRRIRGVDPLINEFVEILVPEQELDLPNFLVKAVSLMDGFMGIGGTGSGGGGLGSNLTSMLPFLLASGSGIGCGANSGINSNLLLALALGSKGSGFQSGKNNKNLLLLLAMQGNNSSSAMQALLFASLLGGKNNDNEKPDHKEKPGA